MENVRYGQRFLSFLMDKYWILVGLCGQDSKNGSLMMAVPPRCGFVMDLTKCHHWQIAIFTLSKLLYFGSTIGALENKRFSRGLTESRCQPSGGSNWQRVSRKTVFCAYRSWTSKPQIPSSVQSVMRNLTQEIIQIEEYTLSNPLGFPLSGQKNAIFHRTENHSQPNDFSFGWKWFSVWL